MRKTILVLTAMALMVVGYAGAALAQTAPSGTLDANTLPVPSFDGGSLHVGECGADCTWTLAQTFTAVNSGNVTSAQVYVYRDSPPESGDLDVRLTTVDASGNPDTTLASATIPGSAVSADWPSLVTASFTEAPPIVAGQQYALVLGSTTGDYAWSYSHPVGEYTGGMLLYNSGSGFHPWCSYGCGVTDGVFAIYLNGSQTPAYDFEGFFRPVDNPEAATNKAKAGSAIPVKFSLGGDQGLDIFEEGYPKSQQIQNPQVAVDGIEQTVTAGSSGLSYDPTTGIYTYVWKTEKGWAGQYRQLVLKFDDGTTINRANFNFTK